MSIICLGVSSVKGILQRAIDSKEVIQIIYMSDKGEISQRYITVVSINPTHMNCYCHYRKQKRVLKISNILSAFPNKKRAG